MTARVERSLEELARNPRPEAAALPEASKEENRYNRLAAAFTSTRVPSGHVFTHQRLQFDDDLCLQLWCTKVPRRVSNGDGVRKPRRALCYISAAFVAKLVSSVAAAGPRTVRA